MKCPPPVAALVSVIILAHGTALAQSQGPPATPLQPPPTADSAPGEKSPAVAFALSFGATVVTLGVGFIGTQSGGEGVGDIMVGTGVVGVAFGPSVGQCYAGHCLSGGLAMRAAGAAVLVGGAALSLSACGWSDPCPGGVAAVLTGLGLIVAGGVWDIVDAPLAARRANRKNHLMIAPAPVSAQDGPRPGLVLAGTF